MNDFRLWDCEDFHTLCSSVLCIYMFYRVIDLSGVHNEYMNVYIRPQRGK